MEILILKLLLTPALIGAVTLAGRRWGAAVSGWLTGLPLTSGPVALYLTIDQGAQFAATAAVGTLVGLISVAVFCVVYSRLAARWSWRRTVGAGSLAFVIATLVLHQVTLSLIPSFVAVCVILAITTRMVPENRDPDLSAVRSRWDLPLRMVVATGFVLLVTAWGTVLGPRLTGLVAPLPIFAGILAIFVHRSQGAATAARLLRGVIQGSFAFATFFLAVALLVERAGIGVTFVSATIAALVVQGRRVIPAWFARMRLRSNSVRRPSTSRRGHD